MIAHLARLAQAEGGTGSISLHRFSLIVANDRRVATMTFSARVARIHATCDHSLVPCLVFAVAENAALHPVGAFRIAPARIRALLWSQTVQMLKDEDTGLLLDGE